MGIPIFSTKKEEVQMDTYKVIRETGITTKYKGYEYLSEAVDIARHTTTKWYITKDIYPVVARKFDTTPQSVEHAIRTVVKAMWRRHRPRIELMMGFEVPYRPSNLEVIDMFAFYIKEKEKEEAYVGRSND